MWKLKEIVIHLSGGKGQLFPLSQVTFLELEEKKIKRGSLFSARVLTQDLQGASAIDFVFDFSAFSIERIFCNGFQSWTLSREYEPHEEIKPLRLFLRPLLLPYGEAHFYKSRAPLYSTDYFYLRNQEDVHLIGSLLVRQAFTFFAYDATKKELIVTVDIQGKEVRPKQIILQLFSVKGDLPSSFREYVKQLGIKTKVLPFAHGYTSWYNLYNKITEKDLLGVLKAYGERQIPLDYFQIDDGWQAKVGDWLLVNEKFPSGLAFLVKEIHKQGYRAGLWLAPFIAEEKALLLQKHAQWLLRDERGKPIKAGFNPLWSYTFYALDWENREFQDYLSEVFARVFQEWKFDLVKLDFLYAAALLPSGGKTRAERMHAAMQFLRRLCGKKIILGCGVSLLQAAGEVDYCRIGPDVGPHWDDRLLRFARFHERVSTVNSLTNTIYRNHQNQLLFGCDGDVFILRTHKQSGSHKPISLSPEQRYTLYLVNYLFSSVFFTSDDPAEYSPAQMHLYYLQFPRPHITVERQMFFKNFITARIRTQKHVYFVAINLGEKKQEITLEDGFWFCREKASFHRGGSRLNLLPYESRVFLSFSAKPYSFAGSLSHILPGSEFQKLQLSPKGLRCDYSDKCRLREALFFVAAPLPKRLGQEWQVENFFWEGIEFYKLTPMRLF
ncbi:MAG: alpha-galactosidase [Leptospiraceae bacterium]|nr:alpha-galactosidase [Leptospiraceae bacterium]